MAKLAALGEQYDGGRDVFVQQEGAHVMLSVEAQSGANAGVCLLTPSQARALSAVLVAIAVNADDYNELRGES